MWQLAAELGHAESLYHLADAYVDGEALARDYVTAYAYARAAELLANGVTREAVIDEARKAVLRASIHLQPSDRARGQQEAQRIVERITAIRKRGRPDA